jgi:transcription antitermination factor NusG
MLSIEKDLGHNQFSSDGWWAIYTRYQHEKSVAEILNAKGFDVFLPQYEVIRARSDRKVRLSVPLFSCYLFVRSESARPVQIITTPGVQMIVRRGEGFALVASEEVEALRRVVTGPYRVEPHPYLQCGERVRISRGALEGVEGILIQKKNLCRLVISADMLGRSASVEVDIKDVVPFAEASSRMYPHSDLPLHIPPMLGQSAVPGF